MEVLYRIDGVLQLAGTLARSLLPNVVARLKLLANMITYRTDIPQEGRILESGGEVEKRVSTFPTYFGEKVVIRMFGGMHQFQRLEDLGLPEEIQRTLSELLNETSGAILFTGPAGSGKTTTLYTCLRELATASRGGRSLMTLEDPIEMLVPGVAQAQINQAVGLDLAAGLRSMMRQDPEVIGVGEIRDLATAEVAFQASLTGHLVLCTFHAGSAAGVIGRLAEMGIEPYVIISGVRAIVCQRLVRRLCTCAATHRRSDRAAGTGRLQRLGRRRLPRCRGTGYRGRVMLAEILDPERPEDQAGHPRPCRRRPPGGDGRPFGHGQALGTRPTGGSGRADRSGRVSTCARHFHCAHRPSCGLTPRRRPRERAAAFEARPGFNRVTDWSSHPGTRSVVVRLQRHQRLSSFLFLRGPVDGLVGRGLTCLGGRPSGRTVCSSPRFLTVRRTHSSPP